MGSLASLSDLVNRLSGGNSGTPDNLWWYKTARVAGTAITAPAVGRMNSMWQWDGYPSGGAAPGAVAAPDNTTTGGLKQADPGGGRQKWLVGGGASAFVAGTVILYDRLLHISGLSGTNTGAQTVAGSLGRYTDGVGNQIWAEIYTAVGATARTITASYTNTGATSGRTTQAVTFGSTGFLEAGRIIVLPLQSGDTGVEAVASVTLSASTGTAGDFGVTVAHPLAYMQLTTAGVGVWRSYMDGYAIPEIKTDACLAMAWYPATTTGPEVMGTITMVEA